jgi:3-deoxy-7-phosphoheptulonate synthase
MKTDATDSQIEAVLRVIEELGFKAHPMPGATRTAIGITGNQGAVDPSHFENLAGVADAIRVSKPYKLISLDLRPEKTIVRVGDATIGGDELAIIAGPCAIESRNQAFAIAEAVKRSGARFFRGGAYKPRTSPYAFQGLGEEGLRILADIREAHGLKIVTEALDEAGVDLWKIRRRYSNRCAQYAELHYCGVLAKQEFRFFSSAGFPQRWTNGCLPRNT